MITEVMRNEELRKELKRIEKEFMTVNQEIVDQMLDKSEKG